MCSQIEASGEVEVCLGAAAEGLQSSVLLIKSLNISFANEVSHICVEHPFFFYQTRIVAQKFKCIFWRAISLIWKYQNGAIAV